MNVLVSRFCTWCPVSVPVPTYQTVGDGAVEAFHKNHRAEVLNEWLTLQMGIDDMIAFIGTRDKWGKQLELESLDATSKETSTNTTDQAIDDSIQGVMDGVLSYMNTIIPKSEKQTMRLRRATSADAEIILKLVQGLALYEKALDEVSVSSSIYQRDGGDIDNPLFYCILVESVVENTPVAVHGMGFFYLGYSTSSGKYLFLEDLFIEKEYRGAGCGKAIMYSLADIATKLSCNRFVWQALDWNTPALNFYNSIGARICNGLMTIRLDEQRIDEMFG